MKRNISLGGLQAFEAASRLLSFTSAAEDLGVTPSAISHQIANLEEMLGTRLFQRMPHGLLLTNDGQVLKPFISVAFEKISQGTSLVKADGTNSQTLQLQVYITVAVRWLMSRLASYRASHPNVQIRLDTTIMDWDFDPNRADMGFVYAVDPEQDGVEYCSLLRARLVLVCTKALARTVMSRAGLTKCTKIEVSKSPRDWEVWLHKNKYDSYRFKDVHLFDSLLLAIEAAIQGTGVLVIPDFIVRDDLMAERLVSPLGKPVPQVGSWYLAYSNAMKFDKGVIGFKKWLAENLAP